MLAKIWWRWRVTLPHKTACKAGAFLVGHIPECAQWHAALVLPQAWVVLETSLCWLARGITAVSNGAASRLRSGISTMASSRLSYWTMAAKRERSAEPGQIPMPRRSLYKNLRPHGQLATHQAVAIRRTAIHNKERTPLRALVFSYPQVFHGGCFGVSGTPPLRLFIYIFI